MISMSARYWTVFWMGIGAFAVSCLAILGMIFAIRLPHTHRVFSATDVPSSDAIIILGAALKPDGRPSDYLTDRLEQGIYLFQLKKAPIIIVTGDNGENYTDEVLVMKNYLLNRGIPEKSILTDERGYRTYESCKREVTVFGIKRGILVTQSFHLPRALALCRHFGMEAVGVSADLREYETEQEQWTRDYLASVKAFLDLYLWEPSPPVIY